MKFKVPRLSPKPSCIERWHGLRSISEAEQASLPGTVSRAVLVQGLLDNLNPLLWEEMSQQQAETSVISGPHGMSIPDSSLPFSF